MSVLLTLVANAATRAVRDAAFPLDEPIDAQGHAKAAALAATIRRVDAAWTSPALRARQTAVALRLDAVVDPALRDMECGTWSGRTLADLQAEAPDAVAAWLSDASAAPHGGESLTDVLGRVAAWLDAATRRPGRVLAVTHPAVMRAAIVVALSAIPHAFWRIDIAPLCQVRLRGDAGRWTLLSVGAVSGRDRLTGQ